MRSVSPLVYLNSLGIHLGHSNLETNSFMYNNIICVVHQNDIINFSKSIFSLRRVLSVVRLYGSLNARLLFHTTNLHLYNVYIRLYLVNLLVLENRHSFFDEQWSFGQLTNFSNQCYRVLNRLFYYKDRLTLSREKVNPVLSFNRSFPERLKDLRALRYFNNIHWLDLLNRIIFYTVYKRIVGVSWSVHVVKMDKFWKLFKFYKFFKNFVSFPDIFLLCDPTNSNLPKIESSSNLIPVISIVDSNSKPQQVTYPLYSNDDSVLLVLFYFSIFCNSYNLGKLKVYNSVFMAK